MRPSFSLAEVERSTRSSETWLCLPCDVDVVQRAVFHPVRERRIDGAVLQRHKKYYLIVGGLGPLGRRRLISVDHAAGGRLVLGHRSLRRLWGHDDGDVRRLLLLFLVVCGVAVVLASDVYRHRERNGKCGHAAAGSGHSPITSVAVA